jgi:hypothetical protein
MEPPIQAEYLQQGLHAARVAKAERRRHQRSCPDNKADGISAHVSCLGGAGGGASVLGTLLQTTLPTADGRGPRYRATRCRGNAKAVPRQCQGRRLPPACLRSPPAYLRSGGATTRMRGRPVASGAGAAGSGAGTAGAGSAILLRVGRSCAHRAARHCAAWARRASARGSEYLCARVWRRGGGGGGERVRVNTPTHTCLSHSGRGTHAAGGHSLHFTLG